MRPGIEGQSYESIRETIRKVPLSLAASERAVVTIDDQGDLFVARDPLGRIELFLRAPELHPTIANVRERVVHDTWETAEGRRFSASRILFPVGDHLDAAAALICVELLRNGYEDDPVGAFARAEPVVDLVLKPLQHAQQALTGLAGELSLLDELLRAHSTPAARHQVFDAWQGWQPSTRDFQLGSVGVEVKATTHSGSVHHIQGWYQVELGASSGHCVETALFLLSIGVQWLPEEASVGQSVEELITGIGTRLSTEDRERLIEHVRSYAGAGFQLDVSGMPAQKAFRQKFALTFERLYDMTDSRISLPHSSDLAAFSHLDIHSVEFDVVLPNQVRGDLNPQVGLRHSVKRILSSMGQGQ